MALRLNDTTNPFAYAHLPDIIYSRLRHFAGQGTEIGRDRYSEAELTDIKRWNTTNPRSDSLVASSIGETIPTFPPSWTLKIARYRFFFFFQLKSWTRSKMEVILF